MGIKIHEQAIVIMHGVLDQMFPAAFMLPFTDIDQLIIILPIAAPVHILIHFYIREARLRLGLDTKSTGH